MVVIDIHHGSHSANPGIMPDAAQDLGHIIKKEAKKQLLPSILPTNTNQVLMEGSQAFEPRSYTNSKNNIQDYDSATRTSSDSSYKKLTRKQKKNQAQEITKNSRSLYKIDRDNENFADVLDKLGFKKGNSKNYNIIKITENKSNSDAVNVLLYREDGEAEITTITQRQFNRIKNFMNLVSTSVSDCNSQPPKYQDDNLNVSSDTETQEKKKEKKESTHTSIYGAILKNLEVEVCDTDGKRLYSLEVERKGGSIALTDIPLQKAPYVLEGGSVEIKGDIYTPDGKEIMKGATFQIDAQGKYKGLRELVQEYFKDSTLCSQEAKEILKLNNDKTTTLELIARGRNDHGCSAAAAAFLLNIVPKSESKTYKMLVKMQNTVNNIVLQPIIDDIDEKKDYRVSVVGAVGGGITKQNHGNLDTEIDLRNAIYFGKVDLNLDFVRLFSDISYRNGSGNIFRDDKQVCEIKNTLTDVQLEAQLRFNIGDIVYFGPVAKYFSKTASTQAGLLDLSNNKGNVDEKDILNELYAGGFLSIDGKLDLSAAYSAYSSADRKGWNAGIRLNDLPIFGNGSVTLNAKGNAFFYDAPVNFVEGASLNGEKYEGYICLAIGEEGIAFVLGGYGSSEKQRFILPGTDPSIVNKLNIKTSDIGAFAGIKFRF